ncbi:MAG: lamin tail domain-containing protein, partial [Myxococcota bacterium]|nr:lamin tail domain-containing protein [Myxococcota bacterium]
IKLNEVFANPDGTDGGYEWIELVNTGDEPQRLDAWQLDVGKSSWGTIAFEFANGTTIEPGGYLVIGGPDVEAADYQSESNLSMGNAGSNADGIRLLDCEGVVVDTLVYGPVNGDGLVDDSGNIATGLAPSPEDDMSLSRWPDGSDSDDGSVDWRSCFSPSPGEENTDCQSGGGDTGRATTPGEIGCGCGASDDLPESELPSEGCTSVPVRRLSWWGLALLVVARRRRRLVP